MTATHATAGADLSKTFHRRVLHPPAIQFSSIQGRSIFKQALAEGGMELYFSLAEVYETQGAPAYCGLGSLSMVLNSLLLDPGRVWQGVWRWFDESMLDCCEDLNIIREKGITMPKLACLARCQGATCTMHYASSDTLGGLEGFRELVRHTSACSTVSSSSSAAALEEGQKQKQEHEQEHEQEQKQEQEQEKQVLIVSYSRSVLSQTGSGHFSPIGGYNTALDMVLIMDVARFKHPPHWVPLALLYQAMCTFDNETGKERGLLIISANKELREKCHGYGTTETTDGNGEMQDVYCAQKCHANGDHSVSGGEKGESASASASATASITASATASVSAVLPLSSSSLQQEHQQRKVHLAKAGAELAILLNNHTCDLCCSTASCHSASN